MKRRATRTAFFVLAALGAASASPLSSRGAALAEDAPRTEASIDPFGDDAKAFLEKQDALFEAGDFDDLLRAATERARDGTAESLYLLGRAHGLMAGDAKAKRETSRYVEQLDRARDAFSRSQEAGGMLYAPALLGLGRCAWVDGDLELSAKHLKSALQIDRHFRMAVLEYAQVQWNRRLAAEAEDALHRFLDEHPHDVEVRLLLGVMLSKQGKGPSAEREFRAVVEQDGKNSRARKLLALTQYAQSKFKDAAEQLEAVRAADPQDDEAYELLFKVYRQLGDADRAIKVLEDLVAAQPGTDQAQRATDLLEAIKKDPKAFRSGVRGDTIESLTNDLKSKDPLVVRAALGKMYELDWDKLPSDVYRMLDQKSHDADVRLAAMRLIRKVGNPRLLPLYEEIILRPDPKYRDSSEAVRAEAARGLADLDTDATLLVLYHLLDDENPDVREAGVQGIASRTGKYFRQELSGPGPGETWEAQRAAYERWWNSPSASMAKRKSVEALEPFLKGDTTGRRRIGLYLLDALADSSERTWRSAYELFRAFTKQSFGSETGETTAEDRAAVTARATTWLREQLQEKR